ncbi:hypothetical protein HY498_00300 [Candidatus Woesearchaeota archaeon]|nr:hypothetical protein [Candidatus Woesearchaeota archaeon]
MNKKGNLLFREESGIRGELNELRGHIETSGKLKEHEFKKLKEVQAKIKELINESRNLRSENDKSNLNFFELRDERNKYNDQVKGLVNQVKELRNKYKSVGRKNLKNPEQIINLIEDLELKIETEGYNFEKEQKVMEQIKKLKKEYEENKDAFEILSEINSLSKQIDEFGQKADEYHEKFIELKEKNKAEYEKFFTIIKKINELRKEDRNIFNNYKKHKINFTANVGLFNNKKRELDKIVNSIESSKARKKEMRLVREKNLIAKKAELVQEKMKKGMKLTNEDLLILQGADDGFA